MYCIPPTCLIIPYSSISGQFYHLERLQRNAPCHSLCVWPGSIRSGSVRHAQKAHERVCLLTNLLTNERCSVNADVKLQKNREGQKPITHVFSHQSFDFLPFACYDTTAYDQIHHFNTRHYTNQFHPVSQSNLSM